MMKRALPLAAAAVLVLAGPATAQSGEDGRFAATTLDIVGHGEARVPPDMATVVLGVGAEGATAAAAMQGAAAATARVTAALRAAGVAAGEMQTSSLSLNPQSAAGGAAVSKPAGYEADNQVTVVVTDLARLGPVIDAAIGAGVAGVAQVSFGLRSRATAENYARLAAVKDLEDKAALFAEAAGYHTKRLVSLRETPAAAAPRMTVAGLARPTPSPAERGDITVGVDVSGEFELGH
jgi:uncharacterized protein YggE